MMPPTPASPRSRPAARAATAPLGAMPGEAIGEAPRPDDGPTRRVRVLIVENDPLVRDLYRVLFAETEEFAAFEIVGEAGTEKEVLRLAREVRPDLVLLDLGLPGPDGVEVARHLRATRPEARILVLTCAPADDPRIGVLVRLGVEGYLDKGAGHAAIAAAMHAVAAGETYLPRAVLRRVAEPDEPTEREREVFSLLARGLGNREIGARLGITESTVVFHVGHLRAKLGAATRTEVVHLARQRGWLP